MLCGLEVPTDLATTSCTPSASKMARTGPPAMMPVPGGRRAHDHPPAPKWPMHIMMQGAALAQRDADHAALGLLGRLADRLRHLAGLAGAMADAALAVADDDQRREAEAPAALHHLGDAVDADQLLDQLAFLAVAAPVATAAVALVASVVTCHTRLLLERQPALAGGVGQGLDPAVKEIAAAVEDDLA